jgi:hypothetical protein
VKKIIMILALSALTACSGQDIAKHVSFGQFVRDDTFCESIDDHDLDTPDRMPLAVACGVTIHFDWVLGHKLPGEK